MQIKTIAYERVKNLGNYESERVRLEIELDEADEPFKGMEALRLMVEKQLQTRPDQLALRNNPHQLRPGSPVVDQATR